MERAAKDLLLRPAGSIYALIDAHSLSESGIEIGGFSSFLQSLGITIAQYRNKYDREAKMLHDLEEIRKRYRGILIVNDDPQLLLKSGCADGLHVGQEDLASFGRDKASAVGYLRSVIDDAILGLSTHTEKEIEVANSLDIDYIGLGAYRDSRTKKGVNAQGERLLEYAKISVYPVALIGGIEYDDEFGEHISYRVMGSALYKKYMRKGQ